MKDINKNQFLKNLSSLVELDSSNKEGANKAIGLYKKIFPEILFEDFEQNGFKAIYSIAEKPEIVLIGHLDTVAPTDKWTNPPFKLTVEGDRAYGLGTVDMKASSIILGYVFSYILQNKIKNVALIINSDEETGGMNTAAPLAEIFGKDVKFVIAGEPTDFGISLGSKGVLWLKITANGVTAHGSRPWMGVNAIEKFLEVYEKVKKLETWNIENKLMGKCSFSLNKLISGDKVNQVPDRCEAYLDTRFIPEVPAEKILYEFKKFENDNIKIEEITRGSSTSAKEDSVFIKRLKKAGDNFLKSTDFKQTNFITKDAASDARHFSEHGIESTVFGVSGSKSHIADEFVDIESCFLFYDILIDFLNNIKDL